MRRKAFTFWQAAGLLMGVVVIAGIVLPIYERRVDNRRRHSCRSNLKQIALGIAQYIQDYDEKFPKVSIDHSGWADMLQPYVPGRYIFHCPYPKGEPGATTDYFYNARLAGRSTAEFDDENSLAKLIMLGDGALGAGTNANITELPFDWARDEESPSRRHLGGAFYAYADGHVMWLKPEAIVARRLTKSGKAAFSLD